MAQRFDHDAYLAELREMTNAELCERLRGRYGIGDARMYKPGPLALAAADRIEHLDKLIRGVADTITEIEHGR